LKTSRCKTQMDTKTTKNTKYKKHLPSSILTKCESNLKTNVGTLIIRKNLTRTYIQEFFVELYQKKPKKYHEMTYNK